MQTAQSLTPVDRLQQLLPELFNPAPPAGQQFLRLQLTADLTIALALDWVEESLQINTQLVTPIPNMPPSVLGLMSSKGQIFWAINLTGLLELPIETALTQYYEVVVIKALPIDSYPNPNQGYPTPETGNELFLGLVVPKIKGTIRLSPDDIISFKAEVVSAEVASPEIEASLQPYLSGRALFDNDTLFILSAAAIGTARSILPA